MLIVSCEWYTAFLEHTYYIKKTHTLQWQSRKKKLHISISLSFMRLWMLYKILHGQQVRCKNRNPSNNHNNEKKVVFFSAYLSCSWQYYFNLFCFQVFKINWQVQWFGGFSLRDCWSYPSWFFWLFCIFKLFNIVCGSALLSFHINIFLDSRFTYTIDAASWLP